MQNFLGIEKTYTNADQSRVVIIPVPLERTTSYGKGTRLGPEAIIKASSYVELYDEEYGYEAYKAGIYTASAIDLDGSVEEVFERITGKFSQFLKKKQFVIGLGGEHAVSFPIYRAFHQHFDQLSVLQLDAHSDLRDSYEDSIYSHAAVMRRIYELNESIVQVGIRSQCVEEAQFIKANNIATYYAHQLYQGGLNKDIINHLKPNVYITIDVDYFDPSIMPSTGTPEPGGGLWYETLALLSEVFKKRNVVGFDVVELAPQEQVYHPDFLAAKLIYKLITLKLASD